MEPPDEWPTAPVGELADVAYLAPEGVWDVVERMAGAGYGDAAIRAILGGNYLRIARAVWR